MDRGNYPVVGFADFQGDSHDFFPSVVAERAGELRYGWSALAVASQAGWTLLRSFKRLLAGSELSLRQEVEIGSTKLLVADLVTGFLGALREAIPAPDDGGIEAVVAVPANAHGTQRFLTLDAFKRAGFEVLALLNEPSAADFEYTHRYRDTPNSRRDRIVVCDLGGGTFDASLVRMTGRRHEVLTTNGLNHLGGDDFDEVLVELVLAEAGLALPTFSTTSLRLLRDRCREAKETLTPTSRRMVIELDETSGEKPVTISVADYYARLTPLIQRSLDALRPVMSRLQDDELDTPDDLAGIYVVGGASALPAVGRVLRDQFGRRVHRSPYPFAAVAIGLAIAADRDAGLVLEERLTRHFGVFREARAGEAISFDPIFTKDVAIPASGDPVTLTRRYRPSHNVGHFRFVECSSVDADGGPAGDIRSFAEVWFPFDRSLRGANNLSDVEIRRTSGNGPLIEESYRIDSAGLVEVTIADLETGFSQAHRLGAA